MIMNNTSNKFTLLGIQKNYSLSKIIFYSPNGFKVIINFGNKVKTDIIAKNIAIP